MDVFVTQPDGRARQVFFLDPDDRSSSTSTKLVLRCFAAASQTERKGSSGTSPLGKTAVPVIANCVPTLSAIEFRLVGTTLHVEALLVCKGRFWSEKANNQMVLLMHIRFIRCDVSQHNKIDKQEAAQERLISKKH